METETITLADFIAQHSITCAARRVDSRPDPLDTWGKDARHFRVTLSARGRREPSLLDAHFPGTVPPAPRRSMSLYFSQGSAHKLPPTAADVLDCLASDASSVRSARSFADWCGELGYDTDSRKAFKTFRACQREARKLKKLLGDEAYQQLLWNVERM